jgi:hypothetical protein
MEIDDFVTGTLKEKKSQLLKKRDLKKQEKLKPGASSPGAK